MHYFTNHLHLLLLLLLQLKSTSIISSELLLMESLPPPPQPSITVQNASVEYMDPTLPPLLPTQNPKCSLHLLQEDFANTNGAPPTSVAFSPPSDCPAPWSRVILDFSAVASDIQQDRIAAIWLDGAEILRTSTPLPMSPGVFWRVRKDITRYTALLRQPSGSAVTENILSMMLENSNTTFPGVYSINITLHFYRGVIHEEELVENQPFKLSAHPTTKGLYKKPADKIIPISNLAGNGSTGFWFQLTNETEAPAVTVMVPNNTYRAVLEIYVSHHGNDEYWYANPLRSNGPELQEVGIGLVAPQANGGFRQVVALIDGRYAGGAIPFPVIQPGSVNPFFWAPVAAIGAYDYPSYDLDITPFVGTLLDGRPHEFGLTVRDCQPYWLVSANLHLWLDAWSDEVEGKLVRYKVPPLRLSRQADWKELEGKSEMEGAVIIRFSGWVSSSLGNVSTSIRHKIKFKSHIEMQDKGVNKQVELESKSRMNIRIERDDEVVGRVLVDTEAPLQLEMISSNGGGGSRFHKTKLTHGLAEMMSVTAGKTAAFSAISDRQDSEGSVLMQDGIAVWGKGDTKSVYKFRDDKTCYLRTVNMVGGKVKEDEASASCTAAGLTGSTAIATL
ncbi:putative peptide-N(4)-(N-acetyl-beta-glucosaminyl)asparagine amidase [Dioscorea sansibarensis]